MDLDVATVLLTLAVLIPSVVLHEVSHGVVALWFGDPTAREAGRLTLNPAPHIDPLGSVILPAFLALSGAGAFGWAKPVPVNRSRMRSPRDNGLLVSLAGPATNIVLAVLAGLALRWFVDPARLGLGSGGWTVRILVAVGVINVILAAFNLIPLPPLDGSAVVERALPVRWLGSWRRLRRYSMIAVLLVVFVFPGGLQRIFGAALDLWAELLIR